MSNDNDDFSGISEDDLPTAPSEEPADLAGTGGTPPPPAAPSKDKLSGIGTLLKKTWGIFKARFWTLILIILLTFLLMIICTAVAFIPILISSSLIFITVIIIFTGMLYVVSRCYAALYYAIPRDCNVREAFKETKGKALPFLWILVLQMSVIMGGYFIFIIPGFILSIWLFLPLFVFIEEDERGMNALLKSMAYVRGHGLSVLWKLFVMFLILGFIGVIPIAGPILSLILTPFPIIFSYLLYHELREIKGDFVFQPSRKWKIGFIVIALIGPLVPIIIIISMVGSMWLMMIPMLLQGMTGMQKDMTFQMQQQDGNSTTTTRLNIQQNTQQIPGTTPGVTPSITNDLRTLLSKNNQPFERGQAAIKLGNSGNLKAAKSLIIALEKDDDWIVRQNAAKALGRLKAKNGVAPLINTLEQDDNVFVRKAAATALGEINNRIAIGPLKKALGDPATVSTYKQDGSYTDVRSVAIAAKEALQKMGVEASVLPPEERQRQSQTTPVPAPTKVTEKTKAPKTASQPYASRPHKEVVDTAALAKIALDKGKTTKERRAAIKELEKNHDKRSMAVLIKSLEEDPEWNVRQYAALGLGKYSDINDARAAMKKALLSDKSVWVRRAAAQALKSTDRGTVNAFLKALKEDSDSTVRGYSAAYLGDIKERYVVTALIEALDREKDSNPRINIVKALLASDDKMAVAAIKRISGEKTIGNSSGKEGYRAQHLKTKKRTRPIKKWVKINYTFEQNIKRATNMKLAWIDRVEAVRTLGNSGKKTASATLIAALEKDPEAFVRREAAIALGKLGDIRNFDELNQAIYDEDQSVREESYAALQVLLGR